MKIKRNIKRINTIIKNDSNQSTKLRSTGRGKYVFPFCDEIPPDIYFSEIKDARNTLTKSGKDAVEVFYVMRNASICSQVVNGINPNEEKKKLYYVRQIYPIDTEYYEHFEDAMSDALQLDGEAFDLNDIIGVTELVSLSYKFSQSIGGFDDRKPWTVDDFAISKEYEEDCGEYGEDIYNEESYNESYFDEYCDENCEGYI